MSCSSGLPRARISWTRPTRKAEVRLDRCRSYRSRSRGAQPFCSTPGNRREWPGHVRVLALADPCDRAHDRATVAFASSAPGVQIDGAVEQRAGERQGSGKARWRPAARCGIARELLLQLGAGERLMRAAAQVWLAFLDCAPVAQRGADMAGVG